ncbi:ARM repeat superfamily protein [Wolffia australiana]
MAACSGDRGGSHLWTVFSGAFFRRKLAEALICGVSNGGARSDWPKEKPCNPPLEESRNRGRSERLSELMKMEEDESASPIDASAARKMDRFEMLQGVVRRLSERDHRTTDAAKDVRRLAKDDAEARETLAMLGAIPPLVSMIKSPDPELQEASLYALLNLGVGNDRNKAAIVEAGAVHKMMALVEASATPSAAEAIAASFLSLSALDANRALIGSSGAIRFLVETFRHPSASSGQAREDALRAIVNLSVVAENVPRIVEAGFVADVVAAIGDMEISEKLLSVLSNAVGSGEGRKAITLSREAIPILVDVLRWSDSPACQEKAAYVLMVMAHKGNGSRSIMIEAGIVSPLLELTLVGSSLAQRRASRILDCLRVSKGKEVTKGFQAVSAPLYGSEEWEDELRISDERKALKSLVHQSLMINMRRIARRANLPQDLGPPDHLKTLTTSKSLPF